MKRLLILAALLPAIFFTNCRTKTSDKNFLVAHEWQLDEIIYADSAYTITPPSEVTIAFSDSTSSVSGRGACNSFFGVYTTEGQDEINIDIQGSTMAFCLDMEFELRYFSLLDLVERYAAEAGELQLSDSDGSVTLLFKPKFTAYQE